jgi:hypothetical protein
LITLGLLRSSIGQADCDVYLFLNLSTIGQKFIARQHMIGGVLIRACFRFKRGAETKRK